MFKAHGAAGSAPARALAEQAAHYLESVPKKDFFMMRHTSGNHSGRKDGEISLIGEIA